MNKVLEEQFLKDFIIKHKQNRLNYELFSIKKRQEAILSLSSCVDQKKIIFSSFKITDSEIEQKLTQFFNKDKDIYILSDDSTIDGTLERFRDGLTRVLNGGSTYIVLFGDNTVFMKDEINIGSPMKYILHKN